MEAQNSHINKNLQGSVQNYFFLGISTASLLSTAFLRFGATNELCFWHCFIVQYRQVNDMDQIVNTRQFCASLKEEGSSHSAAAVLRRLRRRRRRGERADSMEFSREPSGQ
jgi:hypothetical protein